MQTGKWRANQGVLVRQIAQVGKLECQLKQQDFVLGGIAEHQKGRNYENRDRIKTVQKGERTEFGRVQDWTEQSEDGTAAGKNVSRVNIEKKIRERVQWDEARPGRKTEQVRKVFGVAEGKVRKKPGEAVSVGRQWETGDIWCEHKEQGNRETHEVFGGVEGAQYKVGIRKEGKGEDDCVAEDKNWVIGKPDDWQAEDNRIERGAEVNQLPPNNSPVAKERRVQKANRKAISKNIKFGKINQEARRISERLPIKVRQEKVKEPRKKQHHQATGKVH